MNVAQSPRYTEDLLLAVEHVRQKHQADQRLAARSLAPAFNPVELLSPNELRLSAILAWMLNATGSHGQGNSFLIGLLDFLGLERTWLGSGVEVLIEHTIDSGRRLDVVVRGQEAAFAIENKPWAQDQADQIGDYLCHLQKYPRSCLIYLSGARGMRPPPHSLGQDVCDAHLKTGTLRLLTYSDLLPWLNNCAATCEAPRVREFLHEFMDYITRNFESMQSTEEANALVDEMLASPERLSAAAAVANGWPLLQNVLLERLHQHLEEARPSGWLIEGRLNRGKHSRIEIYRQDTPAVAFALGFDGQNLCDLAYGLVSREPNQGDADAIKSRVAKSRFGLGASSAISGRWLWWRYPSGLDPDLPIDSDWLNKASPWLAIQDGTLVDHIFKTAHELFQACDAGTTESDEGTD